MANELHTSYQSGNTVYNTVRNQTGEVLDATVDPYHSTNSWVVWNTANVDDYDIPTADKGGADYVASYPSGTLRITDAGFYIIQGWLQVGGSAANGDLFIGSVEQLWSGTALLRIMDNNGRVEAGVTGFD